MKYFSVARCQMPEDRSYVQNQNLKIKTLLLRNFVTPKK